MYFLATSSSGRMFPRFHIDATVVCGQNLRSPAYGRKRTFDRGWLQTAQEPTNCYFEWPARLFTVEPVGDVWQPHGLRGSASSWWMDELRVLDERPAVELYGPQGKQVAALIDRSQRLTLSQAADLLTLTDRSDSDATVAASSAPGSHQRQGAMAGGWVTPKVMLWDGAQMGAPLSEATRFLPSRLRAFSRNRLHLRLFDDPLGLRAAINALVCRDLIGKVPTRDQARFALAAYDCITLPFTRDQYDFLTLPWRQVVGPIHPDDGDPR